MQYVAELESTINDTVQKGRGILAAAESAPTIATPPVFSATRKVPASSPSRAASMASRTVPVVAGEIASRASQAASSGDNGLSEVVTSWMRASSKVSFRGERDGGFGGW